MGQAWHHALPEYLLVKYHRGAIIAGVKGDFSRPSQATLQYELYLLLPVKPQSQGAYRAFFQAQQAWKRVFRRKAQAGNAQFMTYLRGTKRSFRRNYQQIKRGLLPVTKKQVFAKKKFRRYEGQLIAILHGICRWVIIAYIRYAQCVQLT